MSATTLFIYTDGGSRGNPGPAAIGVHAEMHGQMVFEQSSYIGEATNNTAEYEAVVSAIAWLKSSLSTLPSPVEKIQFFLDSQLVVEQLMGRYKIKQPHILNFVRKIRIEMQSLGKPVTFSHVPREKNARADQLVNQALDAKLSAQ